MTGYAPAGSLIGGTWTGVFDLRNSVLAGSLALVMLGAQAQTQAGQDSLAQQAIPDAPRPQANLPTGSVAPGQGTTSTSNDNSGEPAGTPAPTPSAATPPTATSDQTPTYEPPSGEGAKAMTTLRVQVNFVDLAFTVKDSKNRQVAGLKARDVRVYENGVLQHIAIFTDDALPLSVAPGIYKSITKDEMIRVNDSLSALQYAYTKFVEVSVFTYNQTPKLVTDFTGAQSPRLTQAIDRSKGEGRDTLMAGSLSGPLSQTTVINNQQFDPNTAAVRGHAGIQLDAPREIHALNDAILQAATTLSRRPIDYRRVIYVISDGKEYGSKAKTSEVVKYLMTNRIEVDGTLVGDSAVWGLGVLDRMHLPLMMRDNVLTPYANATGGNIDSEFRTGEIEKSFARIAGEARSRYTVGYYTHEPFLDGKYRTTEIKVLRPGLTILAKKGYWPSAMEMRPRPTTPVQ